ncbi:MAG: phosphoribosylformylglycinamidine synthase subunit PurQ [Deltaproteobacteria bacterium]|nr:MAG: phosphoribosylformylglycinamidine synthase subunit PurQ [Deltaproteobacteria bacterium]
MSQANFLILSGDGINCERETAFAFEQAGGKAQIIHVNKLLENPSILESFQGMAFPGGFSFGDELGSGQVLATKIKHGLLEQFHRFVEDGKLVIGICNGFQVLTKLGLLPNHKKNRTVALAPNNHGQFLNKWVGMNVKTEKCIWTKGIESLELPARHGEGRIVFSAGKEDEIYQELKENGQIVFEYTTDINGSYKKIAGLCNAEGTVLGMMPHPEAALYEATSRIRSSNPWDKTAAMKIFENAIAYYK